MKSSSPKKLPKLEIGHFGLLRGEGFLPVKKSRPSSSTYRKIQTGDCDLQADVCLDALFEKATGMKLLDLPDYIQSKVEDIAYQFAGQQFLADHLVHFETDSKGVPWISITVGGFEREVARVRWKFTDLFSCTMTAHPNHDGCVNARALSRACLQLHQSLEAEIAKYGRPEA